MQNAEWGSEGHRVQSAEIEEDAKFNIFFIHHSSFRIHHLLEPWLQF